MDGKGQVSFITTGRARSDSRPQTNSAALCNKQAASGANAAHEVRVTDVAPAQKNAHRGEKKKKKTPTQRSRKTNTSGAEIREGGVLPESKHIPANAEVEYLHICNVSDVTFTRQLRCRQRGRGKKTKNDSNGI